MWRNLPTEVGSFASPAEAELSRILRPSARRASHHNGWLPVSGPRVWTPRSPMARGPGISATKPKPVAVYTRCGYYSHYVEGINQRCPQGRGRDRCKGTLGSAVSVGDWKACDACNGSGWVGEARCGNCQASGWLFVRRR